MIYKEIPLTEQQYSLVMQIENNSIKNIHKLTDQLKLNLDQNLLTAIYKVINRHIYNKNINKITDKQLFYYLYIYHKVYDISTYDDDNIMIGSLYQKENLIQQYHKRSNSINSLTLNMFNNYFEDYLIKILYHKSIQDLNNMDILIPIDLINDDLYKVFFFVYDKFRYFEQSHYPQQCAINILHINQEIYKFQQLIVHQNMNYYIASVTKNQEYILSVTKATKAIANYDIISSVLYDEIYTQNLFGCNLNDRMSKNVIERWMYYTVNYSRLAYKHTINEMKTILKIYDKDKTILIIRSPDKAKSPIEYKIYEFKTIIFVENKKSNKINQMINNKPEYPSMFVTRMKLINKKIAKATSKFLTNSKKFDKQKYKIQNIETYTVTSSITNKHRVYCKKRLRDYRDSDISRLIDQFYKIHSETLLIKRSMSRFINQKYI